MYCAASLRWTRTSLPGLDIASVARSFSNLRATAQICQASLRFMPPSTPRGRKTPKTSRVGSSSCMALTIRLCLIPRCSPSRKRCARQEWIGSWSAMEIPSIALRIGTSILIIRSQLPTTRSPTHGLASHCAHLLRKFSPRRGSRLATEGGGYPILPRGHHFVALAESRKGAGEDLIRAYLLFLHT